MWFDQALDLLAQSPCCGYRASGPAAVEPTALAAMALAAGGTGRRPSKPCGGWPKCRRRTAAWGSTPPNSQPCWPTGWAVLAWLAAAQAEDRRWTTATERAIAWILSLRGEKSYPSPNLPARHHALRVALGRIDPFLGRAHCHQPPGPEEKRQGRSSPQPGGRRPAVGPHVAFGWVNYGNTIILGNTLRPHVQPTALALAALCDDPAPSQRTCNARWATSTACSASGPPPHRCVTADWGGCARHPAAGRRPVARGRLGAHAEARTPRRTKLALLALAHLGSDCPWFAEVPAGWSARLAAMPRDSDQPLTSKMPRPRRAQPPRVAGGHGP